MYFNFVCIICVCRDVIERIITLGFYYRELNRFATKSRNLSWIRSTNQSPLALTSELSKPKTEKQSVYRRAIANGVMEVLSIYKSAVLHIEQKLLSDTLPILAAVTQGLNKVHCVKFCCPTFRICFYRLQDCMYSFSVCLCGTTCILEACNL